MLCDFILINFKYFLKVQNSVQQKKKKKKKKTHQKKFLNLIIRFEIIDCFSNYVFELQKSESLSTSSLFFKIKYT